MTHARPVARLAGTERQPEVRLTFDRAAVHATSGESLTDWVKRAPRRHWDSETGEWVVNAFGGFPKDLKKAKNPDRVLGRAGFQIITEYDGIDDSLRDVLSLEELVDPVCRQSKNKPALALVRPRFAGWAVAREILGMAAVWDKEHQWFEVPLSSLLLHGRPKKGLIIDKDTVEAARATLLRKHSFGSDKHDDDTLLADAATMAYSTGLNLTDTQTEQFNRLVEVVGEVPDWFGLDLYPYQRLGAIASLAGRNLVTDPTGLGKGSPDHVKILTPTGWTTYGQVGVGDRVVGSNGKPANVIGVYPRGVLPVYKVTFSDRTSVIVDGDHLWTVTLNHSGTRGFIPWECTTVETRRLAELVSAGRQVSTPVVRPVEFDSGIDDPMLASPLERAERLDTLIEPFAETLTHHAADEDEVDEVAWLARSLGMLATVDGLTVHLDGGTHWAPPARTVVSIEPAGEENVTCIAVDADDALYVTEDFIVTHNTRTALAALAIKDVERAVIVVPPVVLTNWARECAASNLAVMPPKPITKAEIKRREKAAKQKVIDAAIAAGIDPEIANRLSFKPKKGKAAPPTTASRGEAASGHVSERLDPLAPPSAGSRGASDQVSVTHGTGGDEVLPNSSEKKSGGFLARLRQRTDPVSLLGDFSDPDPDVPGTPEGKVPRYIALFRPGRKEPDLPERGIVIVADSLLAGRPALRKKIAAWNPDALVYDEAHRARTWSSTRAKAMREMMSMLRLDALRLPMTATPLFSNPAELASLLALSGHLDPVFGGYDAFVEKYCKRNHFNALVARKEALPELKRILAERVWVRRKKSEVLKDLPKVSRRAQFVDVDLAGFRAAHDEVIDKILDWLDFWLESEGDYPNDDDIKDFSRTQIGLMSPLRKAAGVAKVPVALDMISSWLNTEVEVDDKGHLTCERPLLVWGHHQEVIEALVEHADGHLKESDHRMVGVIDGSVSADRRGYYVDEFQAGRLPILVASISAAGVGITLTKGSDQIFIESSYSVPEVSQAIDRQNRIGQTNPVMVTTLIAEGTLDARLQKILNTKSDIINAVLGDDGADVSVVSDADLDDKAGPSEIIEGLVHIAIEQHRKGKVGPKKSAEHEAA